MTGGHRIPTNLRTLMILETFAEADGPLSPADIGRAVGLPKQTIHRLCATLLDEGFLARDGAGRGLRPGRRSRALGAVLLHEAFGQIARRQILQRLSASVGETVNFVSPAEDGMVYVDRVETDWAFRIQLPIGSHVPFHCTASGKIYLASLSPKKRAALISTLNMEKRTPKTITQPTALLSELRQVAKQGYAIDDEEHLEGMVAIAAPVRDATGRYCASIAFHGPVQRLTVSGMIEDFEKLKSAADDLSKLLF